MAAPHQEQKQPPPSSAPLFSPALTASSGNEGGGFNPIPRSVYGGALRLMLSFKQEAPTTLNTCFHSSVPVSGRIEESRMSRVEMGMEETDVVSPHLPSLCLSLSAGDQLFGHIKAADKLRKRRLPAVNRW
nr:hypothetical protein Itr_chr06CG19090 [Ipomoea trifida]GMD06292.1 hypothetical protein Iba_chr06bCG14640 [Ipomoea batatas]GMD06293.1 hypothetical protein Iba_chr06bCG14650 [Ipomoea batatas]